MPPLYPQRRGLNSLNASDSNAVFGRTSWQMFSALKDSDPDRAREALNELCRVYWPPLYAFARREGLFNQVFGFSLFAVLFLWSSLLTYRACEKKRVLLSKTIHDLVVLSFLLRF